MSLRANSISYFYVPCSFPNVNAFLLHIIPVRTPSVAYIMLKLHTADQIASWDIFSFFFFFNEKAALGPFSIQLYSRWTFVITMTIVRLAFKAVPTGSPSRGGDVAVYVFDINQFSLPTPFYSVLVSVSVVMALSTVLIQ